LAHDTDIVLQARGLNAGYGQAQVLHGIDFHVARGEMLVVIGRNGVGKTTLLETICGLTTWQGGELLFKGQDIARLAPHKRNRLGIGWSPQEREVFPSLTVEENLAVVYRGGKWPVEKLYGLFPRLQARRSNYARQLSGGEQQMLAIARALASDPDLLLLDEPVEGLAPLVVQEMVAAINRMRAETQLTIVMVETKHEIALAHSDRCIVLDHGVIVHSSNSTELLADHALLDRLIGVAA
jgi:branched-chain amino acid transport system ATP-binding protein